MEACLHYLARVEEMDGMGDGSDQDAEHACVVDPVIAQKLARWMERPEPRERM